METTVRILAIVDGVVGAAVVVEGALPEYGRRTWQLLGRLPILRRWYRRGVTTVVLGAAGEASGAVTVTVSHGEFPAEMAADERIEILRVRINDIHKRISGIVQDLREEISNSAAATNERVGEMKAQLRVLESNLSRLQTDTLRLNAEGIPLIMTGVVLGASPWADGAAGIVLLVVGGLALSRWLWSQLARPRNA